MARLKGFEPLAHGLEGRCSIQLSYRRTPRSVSQVVLAVKVTPADRTICYHLLRDMSSVFLKKFEFFLDFSNKNIVWEFFTPETT